MRPQEFHMSQSSCALHSMTQLDTAAVIPDSANPTGHSSGSSSRSAAEVTSQVQDAAVGSMPQHEDRVLGGIRPPARHDSLPEAQLAVTSGVIQRSAAEVASQVQDAAVDRSSHIGGSKFDAVQPSDGHDSQPESQGTIGGSLTRRSAAQFTSQVQDAAVGKHPQHKDSKLDAAQLMLGSGTVIQLQTGAEDGGRSGTSTVELGSQVQDPTVTEDPQLAEEIADPALLDLNSTNQSEGGHVGSSLSGTSVRENNFRVQNSTVYEQPQRMHCVINGLMGGSVPGTVTAEIGSRVQDATITGSPQSNDYGHGLNESASLQKAAASPVASVTENATKQLRCEEDFSIVSESSGSVQ